MRNPLLYYSSRRIEDVMDGSRGRIPWKGQSMIRREDPRLLTGHGRFVDDIRLPGCLMLEFLRSPFSEGAITRLDTTEAALGASVLGVFTGADIILQATSRVNPLLPGLVPAPFEPLANETVSAMGQAVAAIVADSAAAARDALELVEFEVDESTPPEAAAPFRHHWQHGDAKTACANAPLNVSAQIDHALVAPAPLEPRAALAQWDGETLTAWLSTQTPNRAREDLAAMLGLSLSKVRVIAPDVGGAFGGKASIYPEDVVVAWASVRLGRPVKWTASRSEEFLSATLGRGSRTEATLGLTKSGQISALRADVEMPFGSWMTYSALAPTNNLGRNLPGPYAIETADISVTGRVTATAAVGIYRGAGRPEAALLMERLVDKAAARIGLDPIAFRRRNILTPSAFPCHSVTGQRYDSANLPGLLDILESVGEYGALRKLQADRRAAGECVGLGLSLCIEPCGRGYETAYLSLEDDGQVLLATGASAQGQGRETTFAQIVADELAIDPAQVTIFEGDTAQVGDGTGALASRSTAIGGSAALLAARDLRQQALNVAAKMLDLPADQIETGPAGLTGHGRSISWTDLARQDPGLSCARTYTTEHEAWSSAACLCLLSLDRETGSVSIERLLLVDDAGHIMNPMLIEGQLQGGLAQAIGCVFMERVVHAEGQVLTGSFMDYAMPRARDVPNLETHKICTPAENPLGAKGVGEAGCIAIPPSILNALHDALEDQERALSLPVSRETLWRRLNGLKDRR